MNSSQMWSIVAGLFFGIWPLLMNRSGQSGSFNAAAFAGLVFVFVLPFALKGGTQPFTAVSVLCVLLAGVAGAAGMLALTYMLSHTPGSRIGWMLVTMVLAQVTVSVLYQLLLDGDISLKKAVGLVIAVLAVWMINS